WEQAATRLKVFEERIARDLAENLYLLRGVCTPGEITLADLPPSLRTRYLGKNQKWLVRGFAKDCLWEQQPLEHFTKVIQKIDPEATGKPFGTLEGLRALESGFQWAGLLALVAIFAMFWQDFRSLRLTLLAMTPLGLGVVLLIGLLGLSGVPLTPASMIV